MRKILMTTCLILTITTASLADDVFSSETLGISMNPPDAGKLGLECPSFQVAMFFMPVELGFAANVSILKQRHAQDMEAYDKLTLSQIKSLKAKLLTHKLKGNEALYEYILNNNGKTLHSYVKAVKDGNYVYCVTAISLASNWETQKAELIKSVDSFRIKEQ